MSGDNTPVRRASIAAMWKGDRSSRLLFESVLIVASVALGFLVTEWRQRAADRDLAQRILTGVVEEVTANRARIAEQIARHDAMIATLRSIQPSGDRSAWDIITSSLESGTETMPMRRAAWDAAVSSGALRLIDYDITARLSDIYGFQEHGYGRATVGIGEGLFVPETFAPGRAPEIIAMFTALVSEVRGQETYLLSIYDTHLPAIQAAAAR